MCTTMIITKGATKSGAMVVTHSDDDELSDQRVVRVPAADHKPGAMRGVLAEAYDYPRLVSKTRGKWYDTAGWPVTPYIGEIPQVEHTYAYFDGNYGIMNEHNLMMGECTNGARYQPSYVTAEDAEKNGTHQRLFYSSELSRIALERCKTARDAIELMGELVDEYGYYSGGETLLVADVDEAWVFEMCALPSETHHSAWIAQRVPDGEMFVAANTFRIRDIVGGDDQLFSDHLLDDLKGCGLWDPSKNPVCDWLPTVSKGEYNHPYYSLRRIWRIMDRVNPDMAFSPWVQDTFTRDYPFSVAPNRKLSREEIFDLYRDHYEGTEFDLTRGIAAGPYGDPHRFVGPYDGKQNAPDGDGRVVAGAWERAISVFYQGYSFVLEVDPNAPKGADGIMWFAPDVSYTSVFTPFWANCADLPKSFQTGNPREYDDHAAWWVFDLLGNWARLNWQRMTEVDIKPMQRSLEARSFCKVEKASERIDSGEDAVKVVTEVANANAGFILGEWQALTRKLFAKYADGYLNPGPDDRRSAKDIGYPASWLSVTDYADGPVSYEMPLRR